MCFQRISQVLHGISFTDSFTLSSILIRNLTKSKNRRQDIKRYQKPEYPRPAGKINGSGDFATCRRRQKPLAGKSAGYKLSDICKKSRRLSSNVVPVRRWSRHLLSREWNTGEYVGSFLSFKRIITGTQLTTQTKSPPRCTMQPVQPSTAIIDCIGSLS